ncbi:MAG TPA: hypothetical protein VHX86_10730 [Tepidisphaeraceae bacterium]|jgi:outer membrane protein assembly factor BamE (lipoprotein component of BamABCDE complex)|nr:hypothetical protein [Tepidisphaeraceae bacterium]
MRTRLLGSIAIICLASFFAGCHSGSSDTASNTPATQPTALPIPPDSIFAKVKMGEERDEVYAAIGQPTRVDRYMTGKAWIPYHFSGSDENRIAAHYKGVGIITFGNDSQYTSGYSVVDITYDPNEPG